MITKLPAIAELLNAEALLKLGGLELVARTVVDGAMSGLHQSSQKGGCSEFSEHRAYNQGDDLRMIDWRIVARSDRWCVKQFDDETNLHAWLVLDTSGSMQFGHSTVTRFDYSRMAAACLARLLLRQRDSIGLIYGPEGRRSVVTPRPQSDHFLSLLHALDTAKAEGPASLAGCLQDLVGRIKRRGIVMVFSDCFGDIDELASSLQLLRLRGHDVIVFQVLTPEEVSFRFRDAIIFEDLEQRNHRLKIDTDQIRRRYLEKFNAFQLKLYASVHDVGCDIVTLRTDQDLGDVLALWLLRRKAK